MTSLLQPMSELRKQLGYEKWMDNWVYYDIIDKCYVGTCPDEAELCRDSDPSRFLLLWEEARNEWDYPNNNDIG